MNASLRDTCDLLSVCDVESVLHCSFCRLPLICKIGPPIREGVAKKAGCHLGNAAKRVHYVCLSGIIQWRWPIGLSRLSNAGISFISLCTVQCFLCHIRSGFLFPHFIASNEMYNTLRIIDTLCSWVSCSHPCWSFKIKIVTKS